VTILSAIKSVSLRTIGRPPSQVTAVFASADRLMLELADLANETAQAIAKEYDWRRLLTLQSVAGDGVETSFALPADYDRMPATGRVMSSRFGAGLAPARDLDQWLDFGLRPFVGVTGRWIILGGRFQVIPALADGETAQFYYVSNKIVIDNANVTKSAFTADGDSFLLPERLLVLGLIWQWRSQKRLEYAEDMSNYQIALAQEIKADKGSRMLYVGQPRISDDFDVAHPPVIV